MEIAKSVHGTTNKLRQDAIRDMARTYARQWYPIADDIPREIPIKEQSLLTRDAIYDPTTEYRYCVQCHITKADVNKRAYALNNVTKRFATHLHSML